jgi:hypothetical protein
MCYKHEVADAGQQYAEAAVMAKPIPEVSEEDFPEKGILRRGWNDDTLRIIQEKNRPVLLFVADMDPFVWPFLRDTFKVMPANARLRELLNDFYSAMFIRADSIPPDLKALGAGSNYHIAVLSPCGLTPMATIEIQRSPEEVVRTIVEILECLVDVWR